MGKYAHVFGGLASIGLGLWIIRATWPLSWHAILAVVPLLFVIGGALAVFIGVAEISDHRSRVRSSATPAAGQHPPA